MESPVSPSSSSVLGSQSNRLSNSTIGTTHLPKIPQISNNPTTNSLISELINQNDVPPGKDHPPRLTHTNSKRKFIPRSVTVGTSEPQMARKNSDIFPQPTTIPTVDKPLPGYKRKNIPPIPAEVNPVEIKVTFSLAGAIDVRGKIVKDPSGEYFVEFCPPQKGLYDANFEYQGEPLWYPIKIGVEQDEIIEFYVGQTNYIPVSDFISSNGILLSTIAQKLTKHVVVFLGPEKTKLVGKLILKNPNNPESLSVEFTPTKVGAYRGQIYHSKSKIPLLPAPWEVYVTIGEVMLQNPSEKRITVGKAGTTISLNPLQSPSGQKMKYTEEEISMTLKGPVDLTIPIKLGPDLSINGVVNPKKPGSYSVQFYYFKVVRILAEEIILVRQEDSLEDLVESIRKTGNLLIPIDLSPLSQGDSAANFKEFLTSFKARIQPFILLREKNWTQILTDVSNDKLHAIFMTIFSDIGSSIREIRLNSDKIKDVRLWSDVEKELLGLNKAIPSFINIIATLFHRQHDRKELAGSMVKMATVLETILSNTQHKLSTYNPYEELSRIDLSYSDTVQIINQIINFINNEEHIRSLSITEVCGKYPIPEDFDSGFKVWIEVVRATLEHIKNPQLDLRGLVGEAVRSMLILKKVILRGYMGERSNAMEVLVVEYNEALIRVLTEKIVVRSPTVALTEFSQKLKQLRATLQM